MKSEAMTTISTLSEISTLGENDNVNDYTTVESSSLDLSADRSDGNFTAYQNGSTQADMENMFMETMQTNHLFHMTMILVKVYPNVLAGIGIPGNLAVILTLLRLRPLSSASLYMLVIAVFDAVVLAVKCTHLVSKQLTILLHIILPKISVIKMKLIS